MARIHISSDPSGRIIVSFSYHPLLVEKVKSIDGRRWHPAEKHWSFPKSNSMLEKILKVFGEEEIPIDPTLKRTLPDFLVSAQPNNLRTIIPNSPFNLRGDKGGLGSGLSPKYDFEDLRRKLVSRNIVTKRSRDISITTRTLSVMSRKNP
jgi:hypothetical protein